MTRFLAAVSLLLASGCTLSVISGIEDGGTGSGSGGSTGAGSITSGRTTGQLAATGSGTASGGHQGSTGQGSGSPGGSTGSSAGSSGGSTTGYTGDAGPCMAFGSKCISDAQCCDGACDGTCGRALGQGCVSDPDCSSQVCTNGQCACATNPASNGSTFGSCASDQDCCSGLVCQQFVAGDSQYGECCNAPGASCQGHDDCCDQNCVDGQCQCLPVGSHCEEPFSGCCSGVCGSDGACQNLPGGECRLSSDCTTYNCDGGLCGSCSLSQGTCSSTPDCCSGLSCAQSLYVPENSYGAPAMDGGDACCGTPGTACSSSGNVTLGAGCCGTCNNGTCACVSATDQCSTDQSCCAGGACMTRASGGGGPLACCQVTGQSCLTDPECCNGNCENQVCACVADGGACGKVGKYAAEGPAACCSSQCSDAGTCL
jgi:hypothetical protein